MKEDAEAINCREDFKRLIALWLSKRVIKRIVSRLNLNKSVGSPKFEPRKQAVNRVLQVDEKILGKLIFFDLSLDYTVTIGKCKFRYIAMT